MGMKNDLRRRAFKGFLARDTGEPALLGKLLVRAEIQAHQQTHLAVGCSRRLFRLMRFRFGFSLGFSGRSWLFDGFRLPGCIASTILGTFEFVEESLVQTKSLLPAVELVTRLLRLLLIRAKIQLDVDVGHESSLRPTTL